MNRVFNLFVIKSILSGLIVGGVFSNSSHASSVLPNESSTINEVPKNLCSPLWDGVKACPLFEIRESAAYLYQEMRNQSAMNLQSCNRDLLSAEVKQILLICLGKNNELYSYSNLKILSSVIDALSALESKCISDGNYIDQREKMTGWVNFLFALEERYLKLEIETRNSRDRMLLPADIREYLENNVKNYSVLTDLTNGEILRTVIPKKINEEQKEFWKKGLSDIFGAKKK